MAETTIDDYHLWVASFEAEWAEHDKFDWLVAGLSQMVFEVPFAVWGKSSGREVKDFLMSFTTKDVAPTAPKGLSPDEIAAAEKQSRAFWEGLAAAAKRRKAAADLKAAQAERVKTGRIKPYPVPRPPPGRFVKKPDPKPTPQVVPGKPVKPPPPKKRK